MVLALFMPSIVKLEHHHERFFCHEKNEKHFHTLHEKCAVCSFEYSVFLSENITIASAKAELLENDPICFYDSPCSDLSKYSFSSRAPPAFTNKI